MIGSALGVLWLAALGAAGIAFLSRAVSWLEPLERLAYGAVLGIVVGSLAVLAIAWRAGLTLALVLGVGITATLVAVALGLRARRAIPGSGEGWAPGSRGARFAFVVIVLLAVRWALLWSSAWTFDDRGLWAGHTYLWGDWSLHLGDVTSFAFGDNFPPVSPRYAGLPHAYHYLTSITAAAMVRLGMDPLAALPFQSFALSVLVALALLAFARRLSGRWDAAALAVILFFVGGGLGWWWSAAGAFQSHDPVGFLRDHVWDRRLQEAHNLRWFNLYYAYLLPQRSTLYGFPLGLLILTMLHRAVSRRAASAWLAAGSIAGLLPFASLGAMLALLLITPALALLFFDFRWLLFFGIWAAAAAPQLLLQQGGAPGAFHLRWQLGWIAGKDPWWWFWLKNLGAFIPLLVAALATRDLVPARERRFLWGFLPVFVIANLVVFQPWDWDNTKVLVWWYLGSCVLVGAWLARAWERWPAVWARAAWLAVLLSMTLSGLLVDLHQGLGQDRHLFLTRDELELARRVRAETPPHALFLVALQNNHPVPVLAGRRVLMSYPGWLWSQGVLSSERERDVRRMYELAPEADSLLRAYRVDFVAVGPVERESFGADTLAWRARFPRPIATSSYDVFDVRGRR